MNVGQLISTGQAHRWVMSRWLSCRICRAFVSVSASLTAMLRPIWIYLAAYRSWVHGRAIQYTLLHHDNQVLPVLHATTRAA
ncbi:hypothetical protein C8Q77DRAFT_783304 [Trametes polyzona]|nr:hypothetical protein C8Q77DRAFT_783304 [Trametes polyzona]